MSLPSSWLSVPVTTSTRADCVGKVARSAFFPSVKSRKPRAESVLQHVGLAPAAPRRRFGEPLREQPQRGQARGRVVARDARRRVQRGELVGASSRHESSSQNTPGTTAPAARSIVSIDFIDPGVDALLGDEHDRHLLRAAGRRRTRADFFRKSSYCASWSFSALFSAFAWLESWRTLLISRSSRSTMTWSTTVDPTRMPSPRARNTAMSETRWNRKLIIGWREPRWARRSRTGRRTAGFRTSP